MVAKFEVFSSAESIVLNDYGTLYSTAFHTLSSQQAQSHRLCMTSLPQGAVYESFALKDDLDIFLRRSQ